MTSEDFSSKIVVDAPPGRVGLHLVDDEGGSGARVTLLNDDSPLVGTIAQGDHIVSIDDVYVGAMNVTGKYDTPKTSFPTPSSLT